MGRGGCCRGRRCALSLHEVDPCGPRDVCVLRHRVAAAVRNWDRVGESPNQVHDLVQDGPVLGVPGHEGALEPHGERPVDQRPPEGHCVLHHVGSELVGGVGVAIKDVRLPGGVQPPDIHVCGSHEAGEVREANGHIPCCALAHVEHDVVRGHIPRQAEPSHIGVRIFCGNVAAARDSRGIARQNPTDAKQGEVPEEYACHGGAYGPMHRARKKILANFSDSLLALRLLLALEGSSITRTQTGFPREATPQLLMRALRPTLGLLELPLPRLSFHGAPRTRLAPTSAPSTRTGHKKRSCGIAAGHACRLSIPTWHLGRRPALTHTHGQRAQW